MEKWRVVWCISHAGHYPLPVLREICRSLLEPCLHRRSNSVSAPHYWGGINFRWVSMTLLARESPWDNGVIGRKCPIVLGVGPTFRWAAHSFPTPPQGGHGSAPGDTWLSEPRSLGADPYLPSRRIESFLRDFQQFAQMIPSGLIQN